MKIERYARNPLLVDVVEVTSENIAEVAAWCGGAITESIAMGPFVKVPVYKPQNERQTQARVGDLVVSSGTPSRPNFKVYNKKSFLAGFTKAPVLTFFSTTPRLRNPE